MAQKSLNEIRNTFLKYFEKNDHKIVESSNLVPNNDPTLMLSLIHISEPTRPY